jgi:hypothetical protein
VEYMFVWQLLFLSSDAKALGKVFNFDYGNFDFEKVNFENGNFEFKFNFELNLGVGWGDDC